MAIFHRKWLSDTSEVYDHWFEYFACKPDQLDKKLAAVIESVPTMGGKDGSEVALQPQLIQVLQLFPQPQ